MELILAVDIKENQVVHGKSGNRANYFPLDWGLASTTELTGYVRELNPKFLYIADLDRIEGTGDHEEIIKSCANRLKNSIVTGDHEVRMILYMILPLFQYLEQKL